MLSLLDQRNSVEFWPMETERVGENPSIDARVSRGPAAPAFFLRTKLLPPRPAPQMLARPRLIERLQENLVRGVTLVTANAGSGKTTLVADFLRTTGEPHVWYQLDQADADPAVFLGYLTQGIRRIAPNFGEPILACLDQSPDDLVGQPERAADILVNEVLDHLEQRLILVLDDYHHLGTETTVHRVMDRLLAYLPDVLHIVIISRDPPPLSLARLSSQSGLDSIELTDLLFTGDEIADLFRRVFDLELTPEQLGEYRERTHGWITALQLVRQVAQRRPAAGRDDAPVDLSEVLRQSERDICDYFAEEVYAAEAEPVQQLLLRLALLDHLDLALGSRLYPDYSCRTHLPMLVRRNVFVTVAGDADGAEYRLHPLFQSFLRRRWRAEVGRVGVAAEHRRVADYFLDAGQADRAVHHLIQAEDFGAAAEIVARHGRNWIAAGALSTLLGFVAAIPAAVLETEPRVLGLQAESLRLRGEFDLAQSVLRRAIALLQKQGDAEGEAEACHSLATIARRRGEFQLAFDQLDRAELLTPDSSKVRFKCGNTRGLCLHMIGDQNAAEREFRAALQLAEELGDEHYVRLISHNLGLPAMVRGDFGEAVRWLRRMLPEESTSGPLPREATAHLNLARCYLYRGDFTACEHHLTQALEIAQVFHLVALRGEIFETFGNYHRELGEFSRAAENYERAARAYEDAGVAVTQHELLEEEAILRLRARDLAAARTRIEDLLETRRASRNELGAHTTALARGLITLAEGDVEKAGVDLEAAADYFRAHGFHYYEAQAAMALAAYDAATGRDTKLPIRIRRAVELAARYDYEFWLQREVRDHAELFRVPEVFEFLPEEIREQLSDTSVALIAAPVTVQPVTVNPTLTDLTIRMLGHIEIIRDPARPLAADAWTTKRAHDILCFIVSRPHHRAAKDVIIDTFWGETDFDAVEKNFHPTISHIRKALNSNQALKQNFLLYRGGDYQLNPEFAYRIDTDEFDRLLVQGESARRSGDIEGAMEAFREAAALYRGEFMAGVYDEWVDEQRSYYREQQLRILEALAEYAQKQERWGESLQLAQAILREDPFREDIHLLAMLAQARSGNRVAVKEQYENLRKLLKQELGVEPAPETQKTYRQLMASGEKG
jgi:ATP/maltotriose-dependent transcriptional regulator MalT/DNA-binding SARP family transcriptional activator